MTTGNDFATRRQAKQGATAAGEARQRRRAAGEARRRRWAAGEVRRQQWAVARQRPWVKLLSHLCKFVKTKKKLEYWLFLFEHFLFHA